MKQPRIFSGVELLKNMGINELLSFDEAMTASKIAQEAGSNSMWPTLSGNDIYALANAAAAIYRKKELTK